MTANLTVDSALAGAAAALAGRSDTPHLDAELLLGHVLHASRTRLKSHPERVLTAAEQSQLRDLVGRRTRGEPLAYILGYREFWSLRIAVSPDVLVPRPETELLVERALAVCPEPALEAVDLGTGSGAIALALARERPQWRITASDISPNALALARANAEANAVSGIEWLSGDWFKPLGDRRFNLIVSNPPYIAADDPALLQPALRHEPQLALTPGADGFAALRQLVESAPRHLKRGGWLLLEHGAQQGAQLRAMLVARGYAHVRSHLDLAGHERVTEARWN